MRTINLLLCFLIAPSLFAKAPSYGTTIGAVEEEQKDKEATSKSKFTISGNITDLLSGETLIGANIYNMDTGEGTSTNEYGFYSLTLSEGNLSIRFSYIGYESQVITIALSENREQNVKLNPSQQLDELVVYGERSETGINSTHMGAVDIPMYVLKSASSLLGEADIMKAVQMMPGVQTGTEGSAGVHVRGGGADENLILLDGVPIYNINPKNS